MAVEEETGGPSRGEDMDQEEQEPGSSLALSEGRRRATICPPVAKVSQHGPHSFLSLCSVPASHSYLSAACVQVLMAHQLEGARWLFGAFWRGGGLLADEPGLGKTLQVITLVEALVRARAIARVLVAAPANLYARPDRTRRPPCARPLADPPGMPPRALFPHRSVANWDDEFQRWLGGSAFELSVDGPPGQSVTAQPHSEGLRLVSAVLRSK